MEPYLLVENLRKTRNAAREFDITDEQNGSNSADHDLYTYISILILIFLIQTLAKLKAF